MDIQENRNITKYTCKNIQCRCLPGQFLCGKDGSVDIGEFLEEEIKGPADFITTITEGGSPRDGSTFSEPGMNGLISSVFGDESIFLQCGSGECLAKTEVPGWERPVKQTNTPLIAGVIAGVALFLVAVILGVWYLSRRSNKHDWAYGPVHLSEEEEEENAKLIADHKPTALHFESVSYNLDGKQILSGIHGAVHPGQMMAVMGASGAGKSTFLDILARKNKKGRVGGEFYVNGEKVDDADFRSVIGFVDQDDTLLPTLTVHETIVDSALLRLPREMTRQAKIQRVEDVERQLGIYHIRDQLIGSEESFGRGISGGEKRRVGIACELVTSPSILFLDEPTSGLDAFNAYNVVECLVNLVKTYNRTVVFTIHQPRSNIVALFDQLILLAKGRTVYSGPFDKCQSYFDTIGHPCPPGFNIADFIVDLSMHAGFEHGFTGDIYHDNQDGSKTRSSSVMGLKSRNSDSNLSRLTDGSRPDLSRRPTNLRRGTSIRQQQEEQLFGRKRAGTVGTNGTGSEDETLLGSATRRSKQSGISQILEDSSQPELPPDVTATGTDLDGLLAAYTSSDVASSVKTDIHSTITSAATANHAPNGTHPTSGSSTPTTSSTPTSLRTYRKPGIPSQFLILSTRTWRNLHRNPQLLLTHYAISIVLAVFLGFLFYGLTDDIAGFQNRLGLFFFILALFGFSTLTSLTVFAPERLLFTRERAKGYYHPIAYFAAKVVFDIIPLRLIPPLILGVVVYPMTGLVAAWPEFLKFILFLLLFNLAAAGICLFIGIVFRQPSVASLVGSLVMLFSLLFAGFLLNRERIPGVARWLQALSIFHYAFEGVIVNEVRYLSLIDHKYGIDIEVPGSAILSTFGFDTQALWMDVVGLAVYAGVFVCAAYAAMHFLLVERR